MQTLILYAGMIAILYFALIMPQQKQQKKLKNMRENLEIGAKVITIGGAVGTITHIQDDEISLKVDDAGTTVKFKKWAIGRLYEDTSK